MEDFTVKVNNQQEQLLLLQMLCGIGLVIHDNYRPETFIKEFNRSDVIVVRPTSTRYQLSGNSSRNYINNIQFGSPEFYQKMSELSEWWVENKVEKPIRIDGSEVEFNEAQKFSYRGQKYTSHELGQLLNLIDAIEDHAILVEGPFNVEGFTIKSGKVSLVDIGCKTVSVDTLKQISERINKHA